MRRGLVTGGAGFIGSHLAESLAREGWHVRVLDNLSTGNIKNLAALKDRVEFIQGDITSADDVARNFGLLCFAVAAVLEGVGLPLLFSSTSVQVR